MQDFQQKKSLKKYAKKEIQTNNFLLDSCIWIGYFTGDSPSTKKLIDSENCLFTSVLTLYEFIKKMNEKGIPKTIIENMVEIIEETNSILKTTSSIAKLATQNSLKYKLHSLDSLLYSTAESQDLLFITFDKHFRKTPKTRILN